MLDSQKTPYTVEICRECGHHKRVDILGGVEECRPCKDGWLKFHDLEDKDVQANR